MWSIAWLFGAIASVSSAFHPVLPLARPLRPTTTVGLMLTSSSTTDSAATFTPIFDFSRKDAKAVDSFERIDDAIMGGISTSAVREVSGRPYASWSGVCRIDGGGFCGMRTLPFEEPLQVGDTDGFYVDCRLTSDDEPERRIWKITTRTERSRGEELYQASFLLPKQNSTEEWVRVQVPFSDFRLVRGPRMVEGAATMNVTGGLYQVGMSLSKFMISRNLTQIENFRPGYFELQLKAIGLYSNAATPELEVAPPSTLSLSESKRKRPLILKVLLPLAKIFFSEKSNRRRAAMKLLTEQRGLSRPKAILFGVRTRASSYGLFYSILQALSIVSVDCFRILTRSLIRVGLVYPLRFTGKVLSIPGKLFSSKQRVPSTTGGIGPNE